MRVWLITIGEPVPVGAKPSDRLHRTGNLARHLAGRGHDVVWWTSTFDHFRKRHLFDADQDRTVDGHLRIRLLHGRGYGTNYSLARFLDHRTIARKLRRLAVTEQAPDIIVAAWPTVELCFEAVRYGRRAGVPVVLDFRDMWPHIIVDALPPLVRPLGRAALSPMFLAGVRAAKGATAIMGITDPFVDWGLRQGRRQRSELDRSFPMGYPEVTLTADQWREADRFWDDRGVGSQGFVACYFGGISRQFDLATVVRAARIVARRQTEILFALCGSGDRLESLRAEAAGCPNVVFPGWVGAVEIQGLLRRSMVGLDPMPDRYDYLATVNNKAIEYLSAGLPVIATPQRGLLAELLQAEGCGLTYACGDAQGLARILLELAGDLGKVEGMSANASRLFRERFTADKVYAEMADFVEHLATVHVPGSPGVSSGTLL